MIFLLFTLLYLRNLIKDKLIDLIERTFDREGSPYLARNDKNLKISYMVLSKAPRRPSGSAHEDLVSLTLPWFGLTVIFIIAKERDRERRERGGREKRKEKTNNNETHLKWLFIVIHSVIVV